jgi:transcriptional regulator of acetoin/glycerol metabolism
VATKNRRRLATHDLSHLDYIDLVVHKGVLIAGAERVADSWQRCLTAHHLDPESRSAPHVITESELRVSREPLHNLIVDAQEEIDRLFAIVRPQEYVVLLCNQDGVAIHHRGDEDQGGRF